MGWNSWNRFGPFISERLVLETADALIETGMRDAGYRYVVIDDAWEASLRDDGELVPSLWKFPRGMGPLADDLHARGLKLGLYTCAGTHTCQGYPASAGNEPRDAKRFAAWGVDFIKVDWCNTRGLDAKATYGVWADAIRATGRPMVFSICEWGRARPWEWAPRLGHLWRTAPDIQDRWDSVVSTLARQAPIAEHAGPDHWNDPDMLEVGNGGMTDDEYRAHFSLWAILAAPLMAGNDVRDMSETTREILTATEVIAVDQDPAGMQGRLLRDEDGRQVWARRLADGSHAVALLNARESPATIHVSWSELGVPADSPLVVRDLWQRADRGSYRESFETSVTTHAAVMLSMRAG
jgi:alpha-galactosidase